MLSKYTEMLSKSKLKYIRSLELKKFRNECRAFVAEGNKLVTDLLPRFRCELLLASPAWMATQGDLQARELIAAGNDDLAKASFLKTPQDVLAVFERPAYRLEEADPANRLVLALDGVQDPGNLGTIIRLADWFGINHIVCSHDTADAFSPKTVQATMGALARVQIHYTDLCAFLARQNAPVYGTFLDGENIYRKSLNPHGILVMGNEGNGIRPEIKKQIGEKLFIPPYPEGHTTSESLNVAVATAIVCAEFRRRETDSPLPV